MLAAIRFKLHFGPYGTPRFKHGAVVQDALRGAVKIVGLTAGRIPWPIGKKGRSKAPVVFIKGLAKALRKESGPAVRHWWGVSVGRVYRWRTALGVEHTNPGTHRLRSAYAKEPFFKRAAQGMVQSARSRSSCKNRNGPARQEAVSPLGRSDGCSPPRNEAVRREPPQDERSLQTARDVAASRRPSVDRPRNGIGEDATTD
jgi:hypothetical protein